MPDPKIKWARSTDGYVSKDERFTIGKTQGRAYTRGPFRNWWSVRDAQSSRYATGLPSLAEAKAWAERAATSPEEFRDADPS